MVESHDPPWNQLLFLLVTSHSSPYFCWWKIAQNLPFFSNLWFFPCGGFHKRGKPQWLDGLFHGQSHLETRMVWGYPYDFGNPPIIHLNLIFPYKPILGNLHILHLLYPLNPLLYPLSPCLLVTNPWYTHRKSIGACQAGLRVEGPGPPRLALLLVRIPRLRGSAALQPRAAVGHRGIQRLTDWGIHLVGGWATPLKNMKVNWDDEIPNLWENKKCSKPPTRSWMKMN